jgi:hypothetical protein
MKRLLLTSIVVSLLAACATPAERRATYIADAQSVCTAAGVPADNSAYAECTIRIYQQQQEARDDAERPLVLRALKMMQPVILATIKSVLPAPAPAIICTTRSVDGQSVTTCQPQAADDAGSDRPKKSQ